MFHPMLIYPTDLLPLKLTTIILYFPLVVIKILIVTIHTRHVYHVMISINVSDSETLSLKIHYAAVHKAPKYGAKVPTNANTPYWIPFVEITS
jgi:hypothetical protein